MSYKHLRKDYTKSSFSFEAASTDPIIQFKLWLDEAVHSGIPDANAMCLSTMNAKGFPSSRFVLLKEVNDQGIVFFTNYRSQKAQDIEKTPQVALNFYWMEMERQVRIQGTATKISREESIQYFDSRPLNSRISSIVSPQSSVIESKKFLEDRVEFLKLQPESIQCPEYWGGYQVKPDMFEFWQGRGDRFHDRLRYSWNQDSFIWSKEILAP